MNIFVLGRLDILSPLFPELWLVIEAPVVENRRVNRD